MPRIITKRFDRSNEHNRASNMKLCSQRSVTGVCRVCRVSARQCAFRSDCVQVFSTYESRRFLVLCVSTRLKISSRAAAQLGHMTVRCSRARPRPNVFLKSSITPTEGSGGHWTITRRRVRVRVRSFLSYGGDKGDVLPCEFSLKFPRDCRDRRPGRESAQPRWSAWCRVFLLGVQEGTVLPGPRPMCASIIDRPAFACDLSSQDLVLFFFKRYHPQYICLQFHRQTDAEVKAAGRMRECHGGFLQPTAQGFDYIAHARGQNFSAVSGSDSIARSLLQGSPLLILDSDPGARQRIGSGACSRAWSSHAGRTTPGHCPSLSTVENPIESSCSIRDGSVEMGNHHELLARADLRSTAECSSTR